MSDALMLSGDSLAALAFCAGAGLIGEVIIRSTLGSLTKRSGSRTLKSISVSVRWLSLWAGALTGIWLALRIIRPEVPAEWRWEVGVAPVVVAILVGTAYSARILGRLVRILTQREDTPLPSGSILVNLTRMAVWVVGGASVLGALGVAIAPLVTALGIGGLAVGLALQPTLENVFSGVQLIGSRQIAPGDFIRLENGDEGTVLDVTWRDTTIRKATNDIVIVPNAVLARATVTNFSTGDPTYVLVIPVSFASASDPDAIVRIALEVAREVVASVPEAVADEEPGVRFAEFAPPAASCNVTIRCVGYQERIAVRHEFIRRLAQRFASEGVEAPPIPFSTAKPRR